MDEQEAGSVQWRDGELAHAVLVVTLAKIAPLPANDDVAALVAARAARILRRLGR